MILISALAIVGALSVQLYMPPKGGDVWPWAPIVGTTALFLPLGIMGWRYVLHPHIVVGELGLHIRNPWKSYLILWEEIEHTEPGYYGVVIHRRSGKPVTGWAVQKANLSRWLGWTTRADEVVNEINELAANRRA